MQEQSLHPQFLLLSLILLHSKSNNKFLQQQKNHVQQTSTPEKAIFLQKYSFYIQRQKSIIKKVITNE